MAQLATPTSDISKTDWAQYAGDFDADAFDELDEGIAAADDGTTAWGCTSSAEVTRTIECGMSALTDPSQSTGHVLRARLQKNSNTGAAATAVLKLYQGTTLIATSPASNALNLTWVTVEYTLSGAEADAITDYTALRLRVEVTFGAGTARTARVSTLEIEIQDPTGTAPTVALSTPADTATGQSTTPALVFTGTDADDDDIRYQVQICDNPDFTGGESLLQDTFSSGGGLTIHAQPTATLTYDSENQTDDRTGQSFTANGGILDKISIHASDDQGEASYPSGTGRILVYAHAGTFGTSSEPANAADPADTPTPDWIAVSDDVTFDNTMSSTMAWYDFTFSGANRVRLQAGTHYVFSFDWQPTDQYEKNMFAVYGDSINSGTLHAGNLYIDGASVNNNGAHADWDLWFRVYETGTLLTKTSGTDAGFSGTPDNTDPFASGQAVTYTVQAGDALANSTTYYWRARAIDPTGTNTYGDWTTARSFTTESAGTSATAAITLGDVTASSAGTVAVAGSAAITLDAITSTAAGTVAITGAAGITLADVTSTAAGTVGSTPAEAEAAITLDSFTTTAAGTVAVAGASAITLGDMTSTSAGTVAIAGSAAVTLADFTLTAAGTVGEVPAEGAAAITLDGITATAAGTVAIAGAAAITLDSITLASAGSAISLEGTAAIVLEGLTLTASGAVAITGLAGITLDGLTITAAGSNFSDPGDRPQYAAQTSTYAAERGQTYPAERGRTYGGNNG